jgi:DNA (cytosine-5)-methyltransferase 1
MNYLDLFSGIGGFRLGLQEAGITPEFEFHAEIDKHANLIYQKHFPKSELLNDIRTIKPIDGKLNGAKINLITFGFPCQDLSVAGKGAGLAGGRSGLFYEAIRLITELKPEVFIFENVKGLYSSSNGSDFTTVLRTIADIGLYDCQWQLLNTRWFLPQNRERIYFIGFIRGSTKRQVFPIGNEIKVSAKSRESAEIQIASTLAGAGGHIANGEYKGMNLIQINNPVHSNDRVYDPKGLAPTLNTMQGGNRQPFIKVKANTDTTCNQAVATVDRKTKNMNGRRIKEKDDAMFTITSQDQHGIYNGSGIRRLTPIECERLQGFPDNWTDGISETQRYKCCGNAVSVPVTKEIFKRIYV